MGPQEQRDEEVANSYSHYGQVESYHDEPDEDDDGTIEPDAPLRGSQRPSAEFDGLGRRPNPSWRDRLRERMPHRLKKVWAATVKWVKGPWPPRIYRITPFFPKFQHAPIALLDRYAPEKAQRFCLLLLLYATWLLVFLLVFWKSFSSALIPGYGIPIRLGCEARHWSEGNGCGLNGDQCRPFANASRAFRCPAECHLAEILNPHAVGDQEVVYRPLVVGGPTARHTGFEDELENNAVYRGDSFICASAVQAGFIQDSEGGCGVLTLTGEQPSFSASKHNGISSLGFNSYFPHSFGFLSGTQAQCKDLRWPALILTVFFTSLLSLFTTSPAVFFWSIFVALFLHVALASDPPSVTDQYSLLSIAFGRFLPACFCGWITYRYTAKRSLIGLTAQIEKTILWLGPAWVGALNNYTFDRMPLQRLTPHDIKAQPGGVTVLISIVLIIFTIALGQAWSFRVEGRMPKYLFIYCLLVGSLLLMLALPGLNLRIHHYILALLLLPGTSFQNRPSLVYQGLLVGLFINGTARWGFGSILETPGELLRGAQQGSLLPVISVLAIRAKTITFNIGSLPILDPKSKVLYDGISVLVNDIERFRGYSDNRKYWDDGYASGGNSSWTWKRHRLGSDVDDLTVDSADSDSIAFPEYFRFGYLAGSRVADYSKAGKWDTHGRWVNMKTGPS